MPGLVCVYLFEQLVICNKHKYNKLPEQASSDDDPSTRPHLRGPQTEQNEIKIKLHTKTTHDLCSYEKLCVCVCAANKFWWEIFNWKFIFVSAHNRSEMVPFLGIIHTYTLYSTYRLHYTHTVNFVQKRNGRDASTGAYRAHIKLIQYYNRH